MSAAAAAAARLAVGARIEVFWPMDDVFYKGVVSRCLPDAQHVVLYDDGAQETLNLRNERYRVLSAPAPPPKPAKKKPVPPRAAPKQPSLDMDLVTYTPPVMPPRKRFRGRHLRSKHSPGQSTSQSPKVLLKQRVRPAKTLASLGDVMSDFSNYTNDSLNFRIMRPRAFHPLSRFRALWNRFAFSQLHGFNLFAFSTPNWSHAPSGTAPETRGNGACQGLAIASPTPFYAGSFKSAQENMSKRL
ncbi:hypothetical protein FGB62_10g34 [Gracilaria domingensis]|nr:hypothetical protein FGB62_162g05 [Gracilaria domingensis]KAI0566304.1 hypothetical protein FGB62_10g34 [Gracilaria domingensis]